MRLRFHHLVTPLAVLALVAAAGCQPKDTTPPPAPRVNPVTTPTMLATQVLSGTAEYGSTVTVTRSPAFTAQDNKMGPFTMTADPFTAQWRFVVPLAQGKTNVFTVTATDAAGNVSQPTTVKIVANPPQAQHLSLLLGSPVVDADTGTLHATATATANEAGVDLSGLKITFTTTFSSGGPSGGVAPVTATTDANGVATVDLTGLNTVGVGKLTATATLGGATASSDFVIRGGAPSNLALQLQATVGGSTVGPGTSIQVPAGTSVSATVVITDGSNNVLNLPFTLLTNAPGALIEGNTIAGITAAGTWTVVAMVQGAAGSSAGILVSSTATLDVQAGPASKVTLTLGTTELRVGEPLAYRTQVTDAFGNVLTPTVTITTTDAAATIDTTAQTIVFATQGLQTVTATVTTASGTLTATGQVVVRPQPDITPPTVSITSPAPGTTFYSGGDIPVVVQASDNGSLSSLRIQVTGSFNYNDMILVTTTPPTTSLTQTFTVPIPGNQWGNVTILVEATDGASNVTVSAPLDLNVAPAQINVGNGGTAVAIAGGRGSAIRRPMGMTLDNSNYLYVACNGGNGNTRAIERINLAVGQNYAVSQFGVTVQDRMADLAWDSTSGNIFVSTGRDWAGGGGSNGVMVMSSGGALGQFSNTNQQMTGLFLEAAGPLLASNWNSQRLETYDSTATPTVNPTGTDNFNGQLNRPWGVVYEQATIGGVQHSATYVVDQNGGANGAIYVEHTTGTGVTATSTVYTVSTSALLNQPTDLLQLPTSGDLLVANSGNGDLVDINISQCDPAPWTAGPTNCQASVVASGFARPTGLAYDAAGNLYVSDYELNAVFMLTGF